ncbi:MAG TPA: apolipoprotein N-acyltransferase [Bacteroidales bacterium]|nr:apolipoprotein N-acyltransferase [Bacteroidales bacterium]
MKKIFLIVLSLVSGILLALAWPSRGFPGLLFIGMVPLLFIEETIYQQKDRFAPFAALFYSYPAFLAWNALTSWWIYNSTGVGAIIAILVNAAFMSIVFQAFHFSRKKLHYKAAGYACLVFYWMAFEYLHLNWILNWPWLNLGNGFGSYYQWVQWYEYTGTFGGTLWVLVANILVFRILAGVLRRWKREDRRWKDILLYSGLVVIWILIPILLSFSMYRHYKETPEPVKVVVVQPNLDPYKEQYSVPPAEVIQRILDLAGNRLDSATNFLVAPESAIQEEMWENDIHSFRSIALLKDIIRRYPDLNILVGGSTYRQFEKGEPLSHSARKFKDGEGYYDAYNTAILVNSMDSLQLYHKSKLTPGVEALPSFGIFKFLEKFAINLGGVVGSLGTDKVRKVFATVKTARAAPTICYESVFGEFFSEFVRNGAQVMFIITNDGWWGDTPGHRQHYAFAALRAIENRRSIARSANTGISAFIDQRGDASQVTGYWVPAAIKGTLNANSRLTFYTIHGDYLARIAAWCTGGVFLLSLVLHFAARKKLN